MRSPWRTRVARYMRRLRPGLTAGERKAFLQLGYIRDILQSYHAYLPDDWSKAVISSAIQAASHDNPILRSYFRK